MSDPLRIAVIGAGAFGRNHLRVLHELEQGTSNLAPSNHKPEHHSALDPSQLKTEQATSPIQLAAVVDADPATRAEAAARYRIPAFAHVDDLLAANLGLHAATVAVPTRSHFATAAQLLESGLDVLVEKPLASTLAEADDLLALAGRHDRILAAGHLERFNPAVAAALCRLTRPMFFEVHRLSIFTPRSLDVDVVFDLMIHDLDILLTMAKSPVTEVRAVGLPVLSPKVDIANVRLEFASGAVANLTASRVSTEQVRKLRLFQPAQYLSLDYARQELLTINVDPTLIHSPVISKSSPPDTSGQPPVLPGMTAAGTSPNPGLTFEKAELPRAEPLRLELEDFLHAVSTRQPARVTGQAARSALALALEISHAMQQHAERAHLA